MGEIEDAKEAVRLAQARLSELLAKQAKDNRETLAASNPVAQELYRLVIIEGKSYTEVAAARGVTPPAIQRHVWRQFAARFPVENEALERRGTTGNRLIPDLRIMREIQKGLQK